MEAQRPDGLTHFGERVDKFLGLLQLQQKQMSESRKARAEEAERRVSLEKGLLVLAHLAHLCG